MAQRQYGWICLASIGVICLASVQAYGEVVRLVYVPQDACGNTALAPGPNGALGERQPWLGGPVAPLYQLPTPTHLVTFHHCLTGQDLKVPMTVPDGIPRLEYRANRLIYNYGSYQIHAVFNPEGTITIIYNSGVFRPIAYR
jgi:hypothetical protein